MVELATRPRVQQRVLVETPAGQAAGATLVPLMGGDGRLGIYPNGSLQRDGHFLARVRSLLTRIVLAASMLDSSRFGSATAKPRTSRGAFCDVQAFQSFNGIEQQVVDDLLAHLARWK